MLTANTCSRCRFRGIARSGDYRESSPCYRFPPSPHVPTGSPRRWPWVYDDDACGEFQPRATAERGEG